MPRMREDDAVRMERLQRVELLANAHEFHGLARDLANGKRGAAARIAIHLGQDHAGDAQPLVELLGGLHGVLPVIASATNRISAG